MTLKKITLFISAAVLFLIPLFALFPTPVWLLNFSDSLFFPFITGKGFYFRILVEVAFASWIILAFLDAKYRPKMNALTVGVTVFALVALVADLLGVNPLRSIWSNYERMEGWLTIVHVWAFFIVLTSLFGSFSDKDGEARKYWYRWLHTSLFVSLIVAGYGLGQLFGLFDIHQGSSRIDASLGNAIYMAVYMLFHSFLSAYFFFVEKAKGISASKVKLWLYGLYTLLTAFLLFETGTRGTILGLLGGVMIALFLYAILAKNETKKSRWIAGSIIGLIIIVGIVFWLNRDSQFVKDNEVLNRLASISLNETKTQARGYVWPMALTGWTQRPILGWGQENFNYVFNANYNPLMWRHEQWFDRAHNIYLDWLINAGIVGLLAYLALYVFALRKIWKSDLSITERSLLTGLIVGYAIHNIFVFDNLASYFLFFATLGFISSFKLQGRTLELRSGREFNTEIIQYIVAPISLVVLVFCIYFFNMRAMSANTQLIAALQSCGGPTPDVTLFEKVLTKNVTMANQEIREHYLTCASNIIKNEQTPNNMKEIFFQLAKKSIDDQIAFAPKDARMYVLGGVFMNEVGMADQAQAYLEKAHILSPHKQSVAATLGISYVNGGKIKEGLELFKQTYESDPTHEQMAQTYALGLVLDGKEGEMKTIFKDRPEIVESIQIAQAYMQLKQYDKAITLIKKLITKDPKNVQMRITLAQAQFTAGMKSAAAETLKGIVKEYPEYEAQLGSTIKELEK